MSLEDQARIPYGDLEAVFFDVGGTLLTIDYEQVRDELAEVGASFTVEQIAREEARARPVVSYAMQNPNEGRDDFPSVFIGAILAGLDFPSPTKREQAKDHLRTKMYPTFGRSDELWNRPIAEADGMLSALCDMGLTIVAVSNSDGSAARSLEHAGLSHHFEHVIDSHIVGHAKPDPRIFLPALAAGEVDAAKTMYVGDTYAADIIGSRAAGLHGLLFHPFNDYMDVDCDTISCLSEIPVRIEAARAP